MNVAVKSNTICHYMNKLTESEIIKLSIKIVDNKLHDAIPYVLQLIEHPNSYGVRGSLIHVMNTLEHPMPLNLIVKTIITDTWEAKQEASFNYYVSERVLTEEELDHAIKTLYPFHLNPRDNNEKKLVDELLLNLREYNKDDDGLYRIPV